MRPLPRVLVLATAVVVAAATPASAQSIWLDRTVPKTLHLEIAKPLIDGDVDGFFTFTPYVSTRLPLSSSLSFVGELPAATFEVEGFFDDETSTTIGNPYLGIESHVNDGSGPWFEIGARLPLASDEEVAVLTGIATDLDRWEAFLPENFFIRGAAHVRRHPEAGSVGFDFRLAPTLWIPEGDDDADVELFTTYGAQLLFRARDVRGGVGLTGRWFTTADEDVEDEVDHQLEAAFDFLAGSVRPGLTLRVPLDDDSILLDDLSDGTIGLTLNFLL